MCVWVKMWSKNEQKLGLDIKPPLSCLHFEFLLLASPSGCQVSGPWDSASLNGLSELVRDLRLCSQGLNKLDRQALKQSWDNSQSHGHFLDRIAKCLLSAAASSK